MCVRRWENGNRSNLYWRVIKVLVVYKLGVLNHFTSGMYLGPRYWNILIKKIVQLWSKYLNQSMVQIYIYLNILIIVGQFSCSKCFNTSGQSLFPLGKMFLDPQFGFYWNGSGIYLSCWENRIQCWMFGITQYWKTKCKGEIPCTVMRHNKNK